MKRMPLSQLHVSSHTNSCNQAQPLCNKLTPPSFSCLFSDATQSKNENTIDFENSTSFLDLQPCEEGTLFDRIDRDMDSPLSSPKVSSTKSSILKKSIKKEKRVPVKPLNHLKLKRTRANGLTKQSKVNLTYKVSPNKPLSQLMSQEIKEEQEPKDLGEIETLQNQSLLLEKKHSACTSSSNRSMKQENFMSEADKSVDKNIYCLNSMSDEVSDCVKKVKISGISVFLGDDCHTYSFPSNKKTLKYVV